MERIIVTAKWHDSNIEKDLDVPSNLPAKQLVELLAKALNPSENDNSAQTGYRILTDPPGHILDFDKTLAQVGAWDGAILVVQPADNATVVHQNKKTADKSGPDVTWSGPLLGFTPLGIDLPGMDGSDQEDSATDKDGYIWKPLED